MGRPTAKDIRFLALEGGGGRGVTYLGAIRALEELGILGVPGQDQIRGIAGSSAGAITAFFLAMGMRAESLDAYVMSEKQADDPERSGLEAFTDDYAFDHPGEIRQVSPQTIGGVRCNAANWRLNPFVSENAWSDFIMENISALAKRMMESKYQDDPLVQKLLFNHSLLGPDQEEGKRLSLLQLLERLRREGLSKPKQKDVDAFSQFIANLLNEGGIYAGVGARGYFQEKMRTCFLNPEISNPLIAERYHRHRSGDEVPGLEGESLPSEEDIHHITFKQFYYLTGVDLRITGTNITENAPVHFSVVDSPDFPVVEAVCISMNIPYLYKPILVDCDVDRSRSGEAGERYNRKFKGLYVDGGMVNNLPIHAFDYFQDGHEAGEGDKSGDVPPKSPEDLAYFERVEAKPLSPYVLGLKLSSNPKEESLEDKLAKYSPMPLSSLSRDLLGTYLSNAEDAQVSLLSEQEQVINLYVHDLSIMEFAPPASKSERPIAEAHEAVHRFFAAERA